MTTTVRHGKSSSKSSEIVNWLEASSIPLEEQPSRHESVLLSSDASDYEHACDEDDDDDAEDPPSAKVASPPNMVLKIALIALLYYPLSIGLTFYQKWFIKTYKLPLLVVSGHYVVKYTLAVVIRALYECVKGPRARVSLRDQLRWLAPIGICASLDIGLSNWALEYVTISLYTMAKSSCILFIVAFSLLLKLERWRPTLGFETALIACGLFLFTWQSSQLDLTGLMLVELAAACTGVRWTVSQLVMQKDESTVRNPLDMVAHVQPWMMIPIIPMIFFFEGPELSWDAVLSYNRSYDPWLVFCLIAAGGILAFCMELSEYLLLVNTSGITLNIFGIVKEVATLLLAHVVNHDRLTQVNVVGLVLCLSGMLVHAMTRRRQRSRPTNELSSEDTRKLLLSEDA
ncbi:unnamed protein product [Caenorhabditis auriculariae]|uniref:Sugar phosphate transporter domain-containing protein n=1 Tax=Caenorhabditis auriculariae TaxID=2777116 RepID=A0A8S1GS52_9PELO|nr:unnamed protein product [Caenorhabditis auriculariae]